MTSGSSRASSTWLRTLSPVALAAAASASSITLADDGRFVFLNFFLLISTSDSAASVGAEKVRTTNARCAREEAGMRARTEAGRSVVEDPIGCRCSVCDEGAEEVAGSEAGVVKSDSGASDSTPDAASRTRYSGSVRGASSADSGEASYYSWILALV